MTSPEAPGWRDIARHPLASLRRSRRVRALRLLAEASPPLLVAAVIFVVAESVLPPFTLIVIGHVTGDIPGAVTHGLGSPEGHRLDGALVLAGVAYALYLLRGPAEDMLATTSRARLTALMQRRLVRAVNAPSGIGHLEDPEVLDRLARAGGELSSDRPADAPMTTLSMVGDRLSGFLACLVIGTFHWWLAVVLIAVWLGVRRPLRQLVLSRVHMFRRATSTLRRSWYLFALAGKAPHAKEVRTFGLADWLIEGYRGSYVEAMAESWAQQRALTRRALLLCLPVLGAYVLVAGALGWAAYHRSVDLRTLAVMLPMLPATMNVGSISINDYKIEAMLTALPDLDSLTEELREHTTLTGTAGKPPGGAIRFERVSFRYPEGDRDVLSELDLELAEGHSLALVGVNGAGKTTLVSLLARMRDPTGGRITVGGVPLTTLPADVWQRRVAVVYQDFTRLPLTARENITMNLDGAPDDPAAIEKAIRRSGSAEVIDGLPGGLETVLSPQYSGGQDLSGGQWQRLALARALYAVEQGATVLVLDEPTAQLDVRAEAAFYDRFLKITAGVTSVVISHRFSTVRRADRIAVLDGGHITELGRHDELLETGGTYARMFNQQAARFR
ncbi:ABC transporter ATP-binding protein [Actinoplanes sp. NPDC051411]|uniref:ABC transporter ATP-binding protein n=1 Tax=Actinoplanes sp. NPDC051411 TaxID=3155522 RepID=UPI00341A6F1A